MEQISSDPAFSSMAKQLQGSVHHKSGKESYPQLDTEEYFDAMQVIMQNPQFVSMAEKLGNALIQVLLCFLCLICKLHSSISTFRSLRKTLMY